MPKTCTTTNCNNPVFSKGKCMRHWKQEYGKPIVGDKFNIHGRSWTVTNIKKSPIKKVSDKQAKLNAQYSKIRKKYLKENPYCRANINCLFGTYATDIHHKKGHGVYFLDTSTFIALCRSCHQWAEMNPERAKEIGISQNRLCK